MMEEQIEMDLGDDEDALVERLGTVLVTFLSDDRYQSAIFADSSFFVDNGDLYIVSRGSYLVSCYARGHWSVVHKVPSDG